MSNHFLKELNETGNISDKSYKEGWELSSKNNPNRTLDCLGLYCPEPVFRTRQELDRMVVDEVLEVIADDPAAEMDIKSLIKRTGNTILKVEKENNVLRVIIKKTKM